MTDEVNHVHMECVWCGLLWKELVRPRMNRAATSTVKDHCPRCGGMGCKTEKRT